MQGLSGGSSFALMAHWLVFLLSSQSKDVFEAEWDEKQTGSCS